MGVLAEHFSDEKGLVWPLNVAPFTVYLVSIGDVAEQANSLYKTLESKNITVLYDDRNERPGAKFADAELMGIPYRVTISERVLAENKIEFTPRSGGETELLTLDELLARIA